MKKTMTCGLALVMSAAAVAACNDSFDDVAPNYEAGAGDGAVGDATAGDGASDATTDGAQVDGAIGDGGSDAATPSRLLLSYNGASSSELVALNVASGQVDGRLTYPGFIGTTSTQSPDPYVLEQSNDVVGKLDRATPWLVRSTWNVTLADKPDGGASYSDPDAVVVGVGTKAYVLRYTRNSIAIIDTSQVADGGAPTGSIDLSSLVQAQDGDGTVEQTAATYVPSKGLVYVLLGNIDRKNVSSDGFTLLCSQTKATIVAIDVATDKVVMLAGGDATGAIVLGGYNPLFGGGLAYDAASDRLVVMYAGCNQPIGDGGAGALTGRIIEEVSLFTGGTRTLLDANTQGFPSGFAFIDARRAIVQFDFTGFETYVWDPSQPTLGPAIPNAPDSFVYDGAGNLLGLTTIYGDGGVVASIDVVSVRIADGKSKKLGQNPFMLTGGFVGGVDLWPRP
jgi:hypothetical protein